MGSPWCNQLDSFLNGALSDSEEPEFQRHARHCPTCRHAVQLDRRVAQLLVEAHARVLVPGNLLARVDQQVATARRRSIVGVALAAAASLLVAGTVGTWWSNWWGRPVQDATNVGQLASGVGTRPPQQEATRADSTSQPVQAAEDNNIAPRVQVTSDPDMMVVPIPTSSPEVTIVWLVRAVNVGAGTE